MSRYEVGQILYVVNQKRFKIVPVQVVEEVVRTTIEGTIKTYMIQFPDPDRTTVDIESINFKCFKTEKLVKEYLLENTKSAIEGMLETANTLKAEVFGVPSTKRVIDFKDLSKAEESVQQEKTDDIIKVDLGEGQIGKLKISNLKGKK